MLSLVIEYYISNFQEMGIVHKDEPDLCVYLLTIIFLLAMPRIQSLHYEIDEYRFPSYQRSDLIDIAGYFGVNGVLLLFRKGSSYIRKSLDHFNRFFIIYVLM